MTLEPISQAPVPTTTTGGRRYIRGRYRVAVEKLGTDGLAYGPVIETSEQPSLAEIEELSGWSEPAARSPTTLSFIGGLPGEVVEIEVSWSLPQPRAGRRAIRHMPPPVTRLITVIEPSPLRVAPRCAVFGECGGCQLQHLSYAAQLDWKTSRVLHAVSAAGLADVQVLPAIGAAVPWNYRNHMRFSVSRQGDAGLTARGTHRVLRLTSCPIAHQRINDVLELVVRQKRRLSPPQLVVRYSEASNHLLLQPAPDTEFGAELVAAGMELRQADMEESLGGRPFRIRPSSFFQTNTRQAERMAELVLAHVPAGRSLTWVDAYCGVGTFARLISEQVGEVVAIEESASAVRDARWNLRDVSNIVLLQGKVEELLPKVERRLDGLVIDPPRAGCRPPVLDALISRRLARVVYVSCNPDTLAEDLAYLCTAHPAYRVVSIQPLDMFPQTAHVETVTLLEAR
ncbi:MAG: class I SAM-dependent RNA methyltransferase [Ktedonobacterales bacterium]